MAYQDKERQALAGSRPSALVYGDVDMNLLDGSAIWLQSVTQALVAAGCAVTLVLKAPVRTDRLIAPLRDAARGHHPLAARRAAAARTDRGVADRRPGGHGARHASTPTRRHDLVVLRGRALVSAAARDGAFDGRLWSYLTDVPQAVPAVTPKAAEDLTVIAKASRYLLCQTEELRCFLEGSVAAACGKSVLFPPVLPALDIHRDPERTVAPPRHPAEARLHGEVRAAVEHAGDDPAAGPAGRRAASPPRCTWSATRCTTTRATPPTSGGCAPRSARSGDAWPSPGVIWHGGQPRAEAMRLAAAGDIGLSWRHPELDASLELSTKVLEFGQLGLPVILNRTPMHEALLGADYPLFAASPGRRGGRGGGRVADPAVFALAAARTSAAAASFALDQAGGPAAGVPGAGGARRGAGAVGAAAAERAAAGGHRRATT